MNSQWHPGLEMPSIRLYRSWYQRSRDSGLCASGHRRRHAAAIMRCNMSSDLKTLDQKKVLLFVAACLWIHLLLRVFKCVCECVCVLASVWTICIKSRAEVDGQGAASHRELSAILHPSQSPSGCLSVNLKQKSIVCFDRHWNPFPVSVICWVNPFELTIYSVSASWICRPIGMWQEGWAPHVRRTHF